MIDILQSIIASILTGLYQPFWFALILSVFFMFLWKNYSSVKVAAVQWGRWFKSEKTFRRMFLLVFYTIMILFRTLLSRTMWQNPIKNVVGVWGLYDADGKLTTEVLENLALFIPFTVLLLWVYRGRIIGETVRLCLVLWQSVRIVFLFSFTIEMLQLFLRLGTWQLSDLFFNTLGGLVGGIIYWLGYQLKRRTARKL